MNKRCIINVANGSWYPRGQERMKKSLEMVGYEEDLLLWENSYPPGCPSHQHTPYAFKPYSFEVALLRGYEQVLWMDSAIWAIDSLKPIWELMGRIGYLLFRNYQIRSGTWTSDDCLMALGKTREESFDYPHLMACCMGLDFSNDVCKEFLNRWKERANDGVSFPGPWTNVNHEASEDDRVSGHRHDQTVASYLSWDLGMREWQPTDLPGPLILYYRDGLEIASETVLLTRGGIKDLELESTVRIRS